MNERLLAGIPLLAALSESDRNELVECLAPRQLAANEPLFWIGDPGEEFFIVEQGRIRICCPDQSGNELTLATLGPGDFLGEIALLDGGPRTATARAEVESTVLSLGRERFREFIRNSPEAALHMMSVLGRRQRDTVDRLRGIRNLEDVLHERMTPWQQVANAVANMAGGQRFLFTHAICFGSWIVLNLSLGAARAPDPFPFPFLCFWASVEAIFLSLFIMISQNLQSQKDRIRTQLEYQVALKMQLEIMQLHQKIDRLPAAVLEQLRAASAGGQAEVLSAENQEFNSEISDVKSQICLLNPET